MEFDLSSDSMIMAIWIFTLIVIFGVSLFVAAKTITKAEDENLGYRVVAIVALTICFMTMVGLLDSGCSIHRKVFASNNIQDSSELALTFSPSSSTMYSYEMEIPRQTNRDQSRRS